MNEYDYKTTTTTTVKTSQDHSFHILSLFNSRDTITILFLLHVMFVKFINVGQSYVTNIAHFFLNSVLMNIKAFLNQTSYLFAKSVH